MSFHKHKNFGRGCGILIWNTGLWIQMGRTLYMWYWKPAR